LDKEKDMTNRVMLSEPAWTVDDMKVVPDFLVIGAMKAASSTVCAYLEDHPEVFMVAGGEPEFFSRDEAWQRGPDWYATHFVARTNERLCGEGSNSYAFSGRYPHAAQRIASCCPEVKIIFMVRDPIARIASAWVQRRVNGRDIVPPTLDEAVMQRADILVDQSLYWKQLSSFRKVIPDERIFIGFMEDMQADQTAFFEKLCTFLSVSPFSEPTRPHANKTAGKKVASRLYSSLRSSPAIYAASRLIPEAWRSRIVVHGLSDTIVQKPRLTPAVRAHLLETLRHDAEALLTHCGKPLDFWNFDEI
jgi:hypothetical protein